MRLQTLVVAALMLLMSCGKSADKREPLGPVDTTKPQPKVTGLAIETNGSLEGLTLTVGATRKFQATATFDSGEKQAVAPMWKTAPKELAEVDTEGLVTALHEGVVQLTAVYGGLTQSLTFTIAPKVPFPQQEPPTLIVKNDRLEQLGDVLNIETYTRHRLRAFAVTHDGQETEVFPDWTSDDPKLVTVEGGVLEALTAGSTKVRATLGELRWSLQVNITHNRNQELLIHLKPERLEQHRRGQMTLGHRKPDGSEEQVTGTCDFSPRSAVRYDVGTGTLEALELGKVAIHCRFQHLEAKAELLVTKRVLLRSLTIRDPGKVHVGDTHKLVAVAKYSDGSEQVGVEATWSLRGDVALAELKADGSLTAKDAGAIVVRAEFEGRSAEIILTLTHAPILSRLKIEPTQYWVFKEEGSELKFNFPWDETPGDEILENPENVKRFAVTCAEETRELLGKTLEHARVAPEMRKVLAQGATSSLIVLVNVVESSDREQALRQLDRDAYFWHWNRDNQRPALAMSRFHEGHWVWEVIASPDDCQQPSGTELIRFLQYVNHRLASKH